MTNTNATEFRNILVDMPDFPGAEVEYWLLTRFAANGTEAFPKKKYVQTLDANGQGTQALPVPSTGAWLWRVVTPDGKPPYNPTLAAGADLQLTTWLASAQSTETAASLADQFAALSDFVAHEADTAGVHGIADTSLLETTAGAQAKADAVASDLTDHETATGTAVHGLGSAAVEAASAFDPAGSAAGVQTNLNAHAALTGTNAHGLGSMSVQNAGSVSITGGSVAGAGNLGPSVYVVASDAPAAEIAKADYACDGVNDEVQIQAAIDALPAAGGKIQLSQGTFYIAQAGTATGDALTQPYCLLIDGADGAITISGMGAGATVIKLANGQPAHSIALLVRGTAAAKRLAPTLVSRIEFDGNFSEQSATWTDWGLITVAYTENVTIDDIYIHDSPRAGIHIFRISHRGRVQNSRIAHSTNGMGLAIESHYARIERNWFDGLPPASANSNASVSVQTNSDIGIVPEGLIFLSNLFTGAFVQLSFAGVRRSLVAFNEFRDANTSTATCLKITHYASGSNYASYENRVIGNLFYNGRTGVLLSGSAGFETQRNRIFGNDFIDGPDIAFFYGILETATSINNDIHHNRFFGVTTPITATPTTQVYRNRGYVTENDGAASIADGGTIAHGCAAAPTVAICSGTVAGEIVTVTSIDATNITVAIKKPDGLAGTTQTVYWQASV